MNRHRAVKALLLLGLGLLGTVAISRAQSAAARTREAHNAPRWVVWVGWVSRRSRATHHLRKSG